MPKATAKRLDFRDVTRSRFADLGWTQTELARRSGVAQAQISNYLSGRRDLTGAAVARLMVAMGLEQVAWKKDRAFDSGGGNRR